MRIAIVIYLLLSFYTGSSQDINQLKVEQPLISGMFLWDNLIIVERDRYTTDKYFICDTTVKKLSPLQIADNSLVLGLTETKSSLYAVSKMNDTYFLLTKHKDEVKWKSENITIQGLNSTELKLLSTDNLLVIVTAENIFYRKTSSSWKSVPINIKNNNGYYQIPKHCLLTSSSLFVGFNNGEWGGSLWEIPFSTEKEKAFGKGELILEDNIVALEYSSQGELWIATGLAHMGLYESGIYKYHNTNLRQILWSTKSLEFDENSDLSAFYLRNNNEPYFIASKLGVFKILNENIEEVIKAKLTLHYRKTPNLISGSSPVGMYVDSMKNIFVAQRSLGVFFYKNLGNTYEFKQINFD